ncbi:uncharacterized protein [Leptinotarsa decemlineata]|uniref:uncharacterized protein n=1 Tax=Leptinotarsa decemlineata TaxID=7539 RepID=UPI003D303F96
MAHIRALVLVSFAVVECFYSFLELLWCLNSIKMENEYLKSLLLNSRDVAKRMFKKIHHHLFIIVLQIYKMKLRLVNGLDPFSLNVSDLDYSIDGVPPVTYMDIASYLVFTHSFYWHVQMKAYKSLESYKYFESGFVVIVETKIEDNLYISVGQVKHSHKANTKPLDIWCLIAKDESICTAHYTFMAGNSEVCSHAGAVDYANTKKAAIVRYIEAEWPMPPMTQIFIE